MRVDRDKVTDIKARLTLAQTEVLLQVGRRARSRPPDADGFVTEDVNRADPREWMPRALALLVIAGAAAGFLIHALVGFRGAYLSYGSGVWLSLAQDLSEHGYSFAISRATSATAGRATSRCFSSLSAFFSN